jgi:hypothetical protein
VVLRALRRSAEIDSRDSHGGQARIKQARFPARKTLCAGQK